MNKAKTSEQNQEVRLDKWLWAARFFKTRGLARDSIQGGKIRYNGQRCKPSRTVDVGAQLLIPRGYDNIEVVVQKILDKRQSAPIAQTMYEETDQSIDQREKNQQARNLAAFHSPRPDNKPDKKQRRDLIKFKNGG